jgi:hypothetical protein
MSTMQWTLIRPVPAETAAVAPVVVGARHPGRRIGFLSNRKPNATVIEEEFARLAREAGLADETHQYEKLEGPGVGAPEELLDRIAAECDVVVVGSAD